jgi:opacity protein-like surface antigen
MSMLVPVSGRRSVTIRRRYVLQVQIVGATAFAYALIPSQRAFAQQLGCSSTFQAQFIQDKVAPVIGGVVSASNSIVSAIGTMNTVFLAPGNAFVAGLPNPQPDQVAGGTWGRMIGGQIDERATGTFTGSTTPGSTVGSAATGQVTCNSNVREGYGGFQVGQDLARLKIGGGSGSLHIGVTGGYAESGAQDLGGSNLTGSFQVPFAGIYAAYANGNFSADLMGRGDFYQMTLSAADAALGNQRLDAFGFTISGSANYKIDLPNRWFIEPSVTGVHSSVKVDTLNLPGGIGNLNNPLFLPPASVQFGNIESDLGRAGVRVGTSFSGGGVNWAPFVTASVWHEFAGNSTATYTAPTFTNGPGSFPNGTGGAVSGSLSTTRVGTYGQYSAGVLGSVPNSPWLGYVRLDYRAGENIEGWGFNAGLRYQFNPSSIVAAPAAGFVKAPRSAASYDWTGFYAGGFAGSAWGTTKWDFPQTATSANPQVAGAIGGGTAGYNKQIGRWVVGAEGDLAFTNAKGGQSCQDGINNINITADCNDDVHLLATAAARVGYAWWDDVLLFAKVGGAWTSNLLNASCDGDAQFPQGGCVPTNDVKGAVQNLTVKDGRFGWTVGAGVELALTPGWSAKFEYDHLDFGSKSLVLPDTTPVNVRESFNEVKVGLNYHFGAEDQAYAGATKIPVKAPPSVAPFNWTGGYVGAAVADRLTKSPWTTTAQHLQDPDVTTTPADFFSTAFQGGLYAGYDWQFAPKLVAGIEGDAAWGSSSMARGGIPGTFGNGEDGIVGIEAEGADSSTVKLGWDSSIRSRVGVLVFPTILVYGTAGVAFQQATVGATCDGSANSQCAAARSEAFSSVRTGWTVGAGLEGVMTGNWLGKLEFRYSDFGRYNNVFFAGTGDDVTANVHIQTYKFLAGVGYKLN